MSIIEAIILGVVQGLTEFLPVSSSGHLVIAERLLGVEVDNLRFEVIVHLGTLAAVVGVFRRRVAGLLRALFRGRVRWTKGGLRFPNQNTRLLWLLVLASIPAVAVGLLAGDGVERAFHSPRLVGVMLLLTGAVLFGTRFVTGGTRPLSGLRSLVVGVAQALAILPGVSRSGTTISAGIYTGVEPETAAEFSFLLSIPVIAGAGAMKIREMIGSGISRSELIVLLAGGLAAALSGCLAIGFLLRVVRRGRFSLFSYYCWAAGVAVLVLVR